MKNENTDQQKSNQQKIQVTLGLVVTILVLILIVIMIIKPNLSQATRLNSELKASEQMRSRLSSKIAELEEAKMNYQAVSAQENIINEAIPSYSDVPIAMKSIEKMAAEIVQEGGPLIITNISVPNMPNDSPTDVENQMQKEKQEVKILVSLVGDYQAIRDFILKIKSLRHNFYLEKIIFSTPQNAASNKNFLNVNLNLSYYYFN